MDMEELRETFDHFDRDDNGIIDRGEFMSLMDALGADLDEEELHIGFAAIDVDDNGVIDFDEFLEWWRDRWG